MSFEARCHCGAVVVKVDADVPGQAVECNCSHCSAKGFLLTFVSPDQFELVSGDESKLTEYLFNKHKIHHRFCPTCGVQSFARGVGPDGKPMVAINLRSIDDLDLGAVKTQKFDGKSM